MGILLLQAGGRNRGTDFGSDYELRFRQVTGSVGIGVILSAP